MIYLRNQVSIKSLRNWWKNQRQKERKKLKLNLQNKKSVMKTTGLNIKIQDEESTNDEPPPLTIAFDSEEDILQ